MKEGRKLLAVILALVVGVIVTGCAGSSRNELRLADIGWDENTAVANLTKVLLEDELGYDNVSIQNVDLGLVFKGVDTGDLDAFQDVWLPNHRELLSQANNVERLGDWYQGQTEFGIGVPSYVNITSIDQLNDTNITEILGIEPGAVISEKVPNDVIPEYGLKQRYVESSTAGMLAEVQRRYDNREEFAFVPWKPHWMNQRYNIRYLDDPKGALGELTQSAEITGIVRNGLGNDDPVAYAFMNNLTLTENQVNDLEDAINSAGDPQEGARQWASNNPNVVQPWIDAAKNAKGS
jgi:glycine betaine/proline transport system substrate-binding protein